MRKVVLAALALGGLAISAVAPAQAQGFPNRNYPFCLRGATTGGTYDCAYTSYRQCQATASGLRAYCVENPLMTRAEIYPGTPVRQRRYQAY